MATIIINHKVNDYNHWRPLFDADSKRRESAGIKEIKVGRRVDDPNNVYMIWEARDIERVKSMVSDPELHEVMKKAGVIGQPEVIILE